MKNLIMLMSLTLLVIPSWAKKTKPVTDVLHWVGETPGHDKPASFGIPFSKGEMPRDGVVNLTDARGQNIPADTWPLAYWPDGSVKWAGVAALIPASTPLVKFSTATMSDVRKRHLSSAVYITELPTYIKVSTGKINAFLPKQGHNIIDSICLGHVKVSGASRLTCTTQDTPALTGDGMLRQQAFQSEIDEVKVERVGNVRALIRVDGHMVGHGRKWLPFTVRLYFYAGSEEVKLVHTLVYDGNMDEDYISSIGLTTDVPMREALYNRHVAFATADGGVWAEPVQPLVGRRVLNLDGDKTMQQRQMRGERIPPVEQFDAKGQHLIKNWAAWDSYRLNQAQSESCTIRKRANAHRPWLGTYAGGRAAGYAFLGDVSGGLGISLKDFWQSCPTALQVDSARSRVAKLTLWLWSPEAPAMDLRHYDDVAHDLEASYEDVQQGMSTPYGMARTHTITLIPSAGYQGKEMVAHTAQQCQADAALMCTPQYLHVKRAFGVWSLPDTSTPQRARVEARLKDFTDYYLQQVEEHKWYGFWNYGDFMHTYDSVRHVWRYDVGGYAWDNTELASNMWLWYSFLRTGRADLWTLAQAMSRHTGECDVYHLGPYAGLGSRHNVSHWGCGAKEARISQAAWNRFYYYLTTDERTGDLMTEVKDAEQMLYTIDPMRLALPRSQYPCTAPARLRVGPDWLAYAGNWMTEWERTGNKAYRDKIITGMKSIASLPRGLFTGPGVLGFDPATGKVSYEGDPKLEHTNHLMTIMGGFQVMNEMMDMINVPSWNKAWLYHAKHYREKAHTISKNRFPVTRLMAYAAAVTGDKQLAADAWSELWNVWNNSRPFDVKTLHGPIVPSPIHENPYVCTNDAATWSLAAIYMQEVIPQD